MRYLEKLDEVARLEIAGMYEDDDKDAARLRPDHSHAASSTIYRRREGATAGVDAVGEGGARHRGRPPHSGRVEPEADADLADLH